MSACVSSKPCVCLPAEVIIQKVPVPIPCPPPPEIPAPDLQIVNLNRNLTPWPQLLQAIIHDYAELRRVEHELRQILANYSTPLPTLPPH
jgi:hypothetical protein